MGLIRGGRVTSLQDTLYKLTEMLQKRGSISEWRESSIERKLIEIKRLSKKEHSKRVTGSR